MKREEATQKILEAKQRMGFTFEALAQQVEVTNQGLERGGVYGGLWLASDGPVVG